jgi:hypothetical protein
LKTNRKQGKHAKTESDYSEREGGILGRGKWKKKGNTVRPPQEKRISKKLKDNFCAILKSKW